MSEFNRAELVLQLLANRATEGLSGSQHEELEAMLAGDPTLPPDALERAAAAVTLALTAVPAEPLPPRLSAALRADAARWFSEVTDGFDRRTDRRIGARPVAETRSRRSSERLGWYAAAAMFLLAIAGWWGDLWPRREPSVEAQFEQFVRRAPDLLRARWAAMVDEYRDVSGEVVWSDAEQTGYMVLRGLPASVGRSQYQLWIVDPRRDTRPVDGGVFDVNAARDAVIIPIQAKLKVQQPTVFAITLEQEGGVVVSDGPLLVAASASG